MDIKVGFADSGRELVISSALQQDEVAAKVSEALANDAGVLDLNDEKGRRYIIRNNKIAYVEVGTSTPRTVGFAGA
ncbi:hypothetical protein CDES_03905 [Corynebacterium deserti GIMN1.010]|uniref:ATP-binding protein n=1 Tax=Corynebacterium deserti GIMN1.010 TaxID=931089 RepID=A0A0M3Q989_9CORY|nr:DUF3107 domain-containing protein [Corynebacterium deserti]ALC05233.1 hypothetical protein CDES_03905 [Corynebacterium deserti GIMN1.010]